MEGVIKMSGKNVNAFKGFVPPFPKAMPKINDDYKAGVKKLLGQMSEMQKSSVESSKEQWNKFFDQVLEMQDTVIESMSDDPISISWLLFGKPYAVSPKEFLKQMKEIEKMTNAHVMEQVDSFVEFSRKKIEMYSAMLGTVVTKAEAPAQADESAEEAK